MATREENVICHIVLQSGYIHKKKKTSVKQSKFIKYKKNGLRRVVRTDRI